MEEKQSVLLNFQWILYRSTIKKTFSEQFLSADNMNKCNEICFE